MAMGVAGAMGVAYGGHRSLPPQRGRSRTLGPRSHAMSSLTASFDLPLGPHAAALARRATADVLRLWGCQDREAVYDVLVVVSELVGNAVRHGADHVLLTLDSRERVLTVGVDDGSAVLPGRRDVDCDGESGRGMRIVEALAERWGVAEHRPGKRVWAELHVPVGADLLQAAGR